jgi:hypothetical protein
MYDCVRKFMHLLEATSPLCYGFLFQKKKAHAWNQHTSIIRQAIKSLFAKNEKDGSIGSTVEVKHTLSGVDITATMNHRGVPSLVAEHNFLFPNRECSPRKLSAVTR